MAQTVNPTRVSFASVKNPVDYPDFLDIQIKSFRDFFQLETKSDERKNEGLYKTFCENFPITDTRNQFVLEFIDYFVDPPRYSIEECIEHGLTYSVPLKARLKLYCTDPDHEDFETIVQDVYLGTIPYMTPSGTFVINGAERIVVSQLHRSPGVFFGQSFHANGTKLYSARIIPFKGSWMEFATDINNVMYAYIDRKKKLPLTTLLRAIGYERDKDILDIFDLAEEVKVSKTGLKKYIGRRLAARVLKTWVEDFVDEDTGEVVSIERNEQILDRDTILEKENIDEIVDAGVKTILLHKEDSTSSEYSIIYNTLQKDPTNSEKEAVEHIYRQLRNAEPPDEETARGIIEKLFFSDTRYSLGDVGRYRINKKLGLDTPLSVQVLTKEDIMNGALKAFKGGWDKVKLYFMMGLPTETYDDIAGIADLSEEITELFFANIPREERNGRVMVTASASYFVPKPFTPFQWAPMIRPEEFVKRAYFVKDRFREEKNHKSLKFQYHEADITILEGLLARGDRKLCDVIYDVYRSGQIYDAWTEFFKKENWDNSMAKHGLDIDFYTYRDRNVDEILPWDFIDIGVTRGFLEREWENAQNEKVTPNCRQQCSGCGAARFGGGVCFENKN